MSSYSVRVIFIKSLIINKYVRTSSGQELTLWNIPYDTLPDWCGMFGKSFLGGAILHLSVGNVEYNQYDYFVKY